jgi:hypothetical protein
MKEKRALQKKTRKTTNFDIPASRRIGKGGGRNRGREIARVCTINLTSRGALILKYIIRNKNY